MRKAPDPTTSQSGRAEAQGPPDSTHRSGACLRGGRAPVAHPSGRAGVGKRPGAIPASPPQADSPLGDGRPASRKWPAGSGRQAPSVRFVCKHPLTVSYHLRIGLSSPFSPLSRSPLSSSWLFLFLLSAFLAPFPRVR